MEKEKTKKTRLKFYLPVLFAAILAIGVYIGMNLNFSRLPESLEKKFKSIGIGRYDKINDVLNYIHNSYVDEIDREELEEETIKSFLRNLDPHSVYIPAKDFREFHDPLMGSFEGIGIEFNMIADTVVVINPIVGGPSEKAGILPGDRIVEVDGETIAGVNMSTDKIVRKLKGPKDTKVELTIYRHNIDEFFDYTITRDKIPAHSLDIAYMLDDATGYIKISRFAATTHNEFITAFDRLKRNGMENLILDLRGNGGGFLDAAILLADEFLSPGQMIVYTKGQKRPKQIANARRNGRFESKPLVVLIDEWSASASEIIAGAVQDNDRGIVIGRRSFGKGLVQEQVQLSDGSALRLTVARYYTPSGRSIQSPYDAGVDTYYDDFIQRFINGEHESQDSIKKQDSLRFETKKGRIVYAGGGIMPDIFVPVDSEKRTPFFNQVINRGLIYRFAFNYSDNNRQILSSAYSDANHFINDFSISEDVFNDFIEFAVSKGIKPGNNIEKSKSIISQQLKAYIGRNIWGNEAFFPVLNQDDAVLEKAMEMISQEKYKSVLTLNPDKK